MKAGPQRYEGLVYPSGFSSLTQSCEAVAEFLVTDDELLIEGYFSVPLQSAKRALIVSIPFASLTPFAASARVQLKDFGTYPGPLVTDGDGFMFIGRNAEVTIALHLSLPSSDSLTLSGMVQFPQRALSFVARPSTQWKESATAKVVSLHTALRKQP